MNFGGGRGGAQGSASTERKRNEKRELAASEKALLDALLGVLQKFQPQSAVGRQAHEASQDQGKGKGKIRGRALLKTLKLVRAPLPMFPMVGY